MESDEQAYRNFQRHVDRLCFLIVATDCSDLEIDIERLHLRTQVMKLFPEKMSLYELVYESRFRRLREQFRRKRNPEPGIWNLEASLYRSQILRDF
jgi:hypothetical protein